MVRGTTAATAMRTVALVVVVVVVVMQQAAVVSGLVYTVQENTATAGGGGGAGGSGGLQDRREVVWRASEGPMFAPADTPYGPADPSYIAFNGVITVPAAAAARRTLMVNLVATDEASYEFLGLYQVDTGDKQFCCTTKSSTCAGPGRPYIMGNGSMPASHLPLVLSVPVSSEHTAVAFKYLLRRSGEQDLWIGVCDENGEPVPDVDIGGQLVFRNPYGYLIGWQYGYIPWYGALTVAYSVLLLCYSCLAVYNRRSLLPLQYVVLALIVVGFVEVLTWTLAYSGKNSSGSPECCPLAADLVFGTVLQVTKSTVSRTLVLLVSLGYGVVHTRLPRKVVMSVGLLSYVRVGVVLRDSRAAASTHRVAYFGAALLSELVDSDMPQKSNPWWGLPQVLLDVVFIWWIYVGMETMRVHLLETQQPAKLSMYTKLWRCLAVFVGVSVVFYAAVLLMLMGVLPFDWKFLWAIDAFWALLFLAILTAVAVIWLPTPSTMQYALYSQPNADADVDGADRPDDADGLQLAALSVSVDGDMFPNRDAQPARADDVDDLEGHAIVHDDDDGDEEDAEDGHGDHLSQDGRSLDIGTQPPAGDGDGDGDGDEGVVTVDLTEPIVHARADVSK